MSTNSLEDLRRDCEAATPQPYWREPGNSNALGVALAIQAALKAERMAEEREAFISLARTQKRLSWVCRRWALESECEGNFDAYHRYAGEARRLWRDARRHIQCARERNPR